MLKAIGIVVIIAGIGFFLYLLFFTAKFNNKDKSKESNDTKNHNDDEL